MKQYLLCSYLLCCYSFIYGQEKSIEFKPILINKCTSYKEPFSSIFVTAYCLADQEYYEMDETGSIFLPDTGSYRIEMSYFDTTCTDELDTLIHLATRSVTTDTFYTFCIPQQSYFEIDAATFDCNAFHITYYPNGNIKLTAKFENGNFIDTVKQFYETGELQMKLYNTQRWVYSNKKGTHFYRTPGKNRRLIYHHKTTHIIYYDKARNILSRIISDSRSTY